MKKIIRRGIATMLSITALVSVTFAQDLAINTVPADAALTAPGKEGSEPAYLNDVNGKVLKSFRKSFGVRPDAKWSKSDNRFVATFKDSAMYTNVYFKSNGELQYTIKYYSEDQLPAAVRHTVRSNFYDYRITQVSEVIAQGFTCYLVKIEDKSSIKTVRVDGEEWKVVEELLKQSQTIAPAKE